MRIAVAQTLVQRSRRTTTLQQALHALDRAADTDPAPDLIVLPAFCDALEHLTGDNYAGERIPGPCVSAIGCHARQWGVYVAMGLAERRSDGVALTAVLLDPDADALLIRREGEPIDLQSFDATQPESMTICKDMLNTRVALVCGRDWLDAAVWDACKAASAALIVGPACWSGAVRGHVPKPDQIRDQVRSNTKRHSMFAAMADVTTGDPKAEGTCPGVSMIADSTGGVLAQSRAWTIESLVTVVKPSTRASQRRDS